MLPLLRHVILDDNKSSTYKLALLRALCRIADGSSGLIRGHPDAEHVGVPLGLVALAWIRLFLALLRNSLPQSVLNTHAGEALGFAKSGFRTLLAAEVRPADLQPGGVLPSDLSRMLDAALAESAKTISEMPARYTTLPGGDKPVFSVNRSSTLRPRSAMLDAAYLRSFGKLRVPRHLWQAMQRFACWVEPALVAEWIRLMRSYAIGQGRSLSSDALAAGVTRAEPDRNTASPRRRALELLDTAKPLHCVWSGKRLTADTVDIDHCFPWSAWPCGRPVELAPRRPAPEPAQQTRSAAGRDDANCGRSCDLQLVE